MLRLAFMLKFVLRASPCLQILQHLSSGNYMIVSTGGDLKDGVLEALRTGPFAVNVLLPEPDFCHHVKWEQEGGTSSTAHASSRRRIYRLRWCGQDRNAP